MMAGTVPNPLPSADIQRLFPIKRDLISPGVFEVGLVLGGTVSAGAYTAGVLDFLIQALDAWTRAKHDRPTEVPQHEVVISTVAGTSGGAINGAILTRVAGWEFDHAAVDGNPFYSAWTQGVDLMALLSAAPEAGAGGFFSLLNCSAIDTMGDNVIGWTGRPLGSGASPSQRSYFADPLRLLAMVGNVTGIPYSISLTGESALAHELVGHADFARFALTVPGGVADPIQVRPDELALSSASPLNWDRLKAAALATSAFPLALRARPLDRPLELFGYRVAVVPQDSGPPEVVQLVPKWDVLRGTNPTGGPIPFVNVDGGTMNNEPIDVVRMALAGYGARNLRAGDQADRAVVLVDPFSDPETLGPADVKPVQDLLGPFVMSLIYQNRMKPVDIALAKDSETYSRFLIAPYGPDPHKQFALGAGSQIIASGGLAGFMGFIDIRFMQYDFLLGRRNAYEFLKKEFMLPDSNPLHRNAKWPVALEQSLGETVGSQRFLPIIPVMPELDAAPPPMPTPQQWPKLTEFPPALSDAIAARLDTIYTALRTAVLPSSGLSRAAGSIYLWAGWKAGIRSALRDAAVEAIRSALTTQGLL